MSKEEGESHTKKRNVKKKDEDLVELEDKESQSKKNLKKILPFSLSAGKVMNQAKDSFFSAIKISVDMANTIRKLMILEKTYLELKQKKESFKS